MIPLAALPALAAVKSFGLSWWKAAVGAAIVAGPCFLLGQCDGAADQKARDEAAWAIAAAEALRVDSAAKEKAGAERLADAADVADLKKELTDAVADLPDEVPSPRRVALGCARLRNAGKSTAHLPACGGPEAGAQARPAR